MWPLNDKTMTGKLLSLFVMVDCGELKDKVQSGPGSVTPPNLKA